jgi:hypothetical protein
MPPDTAPRIRPLWGRLVLALVLFVMLPGMLSVLVYSFTYVVRNLDPENPGAMSQPDEEELKRLVEEPGLRLVTIFIQVLVGFVLTVGLTWFVDRRPLGSLGFAVRNPKPAAVGWGAFLGIILSAVIVLTIAALGGRHVRFEGFTGHPGWWVWPVVVLLVGAAFVEEWFLRGYVYVNFREQIPAARAILLTALLFTAVHLNTPGGGVLGWINVFLVGIVLGQLRELTGGLHVPVGLHAGWNLTLGMVLGAELSGMTLPSLFRVSFQDLDTALGGGEFGPEGSLVTTVLLGGLTVLLARRLAPPPREI